MAIIYVGPSSAGAADGTSWANRYGTLNAAEDKPVVAGDEVVVGPGVYRELLTCDVSGSAGNPITYTADVSGARTDGVGGVVRITGSDNDQTATRSNCISAISKDYRTFSGFAFDTTTGIVITLATSCSNWIIQDCHFGALGVNNNTINLAGTGTTNTIRRCIFLPTRGTSILFVHGSTVSNTDHLVENCLFIGMRGACVSSTRIGGIAVKHCTFLASGTGVLVGTSLAAGQILAVNNCQIVACNSGVNGTVTGEIVENYNSFWGNNTDRTQTGTGANSNIFPPLFMPLLLLSGYHLPELLLFALSSWSLVRRIAGTSMSSDGLYGIARPATDSKKSWGAIQYIDLDREVTTVRTGSASLKLADAGRFQMFVPTSNVSTVFSCYVFFETDYTGTKPQMIIKQPGQSDVTVTAVGAVNTWELLTTTLTPAVSPGYVIVEFVSNNTATSGSYATYVDDFTSS